MVIKLFFFGNKVSKYLWFFFAMDTRNCSFMEHMSKYLNFSLKFAFLLLLYRLQVE
jgi:hypothetical protein